jgi:GNAT superfamily N-acetyltransferase
MIGSDMRVYEASHWCQPDPLVGHNGLDQKLLMQYNQLVRDLSPDHQDLTMDDFENLIAARTEIVALLFVGDDLRGTAQASLIQPGGVRTVWIEKVIVHSDYRGRGLGRHLMEEIEDFARSSFADGGQLRICLTSRLERGTKQFYESLGYTAVPTVRYQK